MATGMQGEPAVAHLPLPLSPGQAGRQEQRTEAPGRGGECRPAGHRANPAAPAAGTAPSSSRQQVSWEQLGTAVGIIAQIPSRALESSDLSFLLPSALNLSGLQPGPQGAHQLPGLGFGCK